MWVERRYLLFCIKRHPAIHDKIIKIPLSSSKVVNTLGKMLRIKWMDLHFIFVLECSLCFLPRPEKKLASVPTPVVLPLRIPFFFDEEKITPLKGAQLYGYNPKPILGRKNKQTLCHAACVEFVNYMTNKAHWRRHRSKLSRVKRRVQWLCLVGSTRSATW